MNKWTLIGLIRCECTDFNQKDTCVAMVKDILGRELPDGIGMVIWLDMCAAWIKEIDPTYVTPPNPDTQMDTRFYAVEKLAAPNGSLKSRLVSVDPGIDPPPTIQVGADVGTFLHYVATGPYAGEQNLLLLWGHGTSYGVFWNVVPPTTGNRYYMLDASDIHSAINAAFPNQAIQKVNLVIAVSCYLNFLDTCLLLSSAGVEYLVAAPDGNDFVGYNYEVILNNIYAKPAISPKEIALLTVTSIAQPGSDMSGRINQLKDAAIFADDLSVTGQVADLVNELGTALQQELSTPARLKLIVQASKMVPGYNPTLYYDIDLYRFLTALEQTFEPGWQAGIIGQLRQMHDAFHLTHYTGDNLRGKPQEPQGVTVCMPPRKTNSDSLSFYLRYFTPDSRWPSPFANGAWAKFVEKYV